MLFNSFEFLIFLPTVFILYWFVFHKELKVQNVLVLLASYLFYGWWDWRFLSLIIASSFLDYSIGLQLKATDDERRRKLLLFVSLAFNLGLLGFFKYFNFFIGSFMDAFGMLGFEMHLSTLQIILPVGISFYTFQTLSYTIDVYRRKLEPTTDIISFFTFVAFFPQLVAGPIERATNLLPQFYKARTFDYDQAKDGLRQILWGMFKKVVIADNAAIAVNAIFANPDEFGASTLILGGVFFAFQIYGDFSGYSDIAIGTARLFGFNLMTNFRYPYFSRDIAEFWRRWHISLSTWFRDYLYIPLGGSKGGRNMRLRNTFIIFVVSGFWHGANWTFVFWGFLNALYFIPLLLAGKNRRYLDVVAHGRFLPTGREFLQMLFTFTITVFAWIFFRADSITVAFQYIAGIFDFSTLLERPKYITRSFLIIVLLAFEWIQRDKEHGLVIDHWPVGVRWSVYWVLMASILYFFGSNQTFIYFQF